MLAVCLSQLTFGQKIAELQMSFDKNTIGVPVRVNLDEITHLPAAEIVLVEVKGNERIAVPYQIENKGERMMYWLIQPEVNSPNKRTYELIKGDKKDKQVPLSVSKDNGALIISAKDRKLLQYNYKTHYPPVGVDMAFKRSGFIHPLWTPNGQTLTRVDAPDHYHHYGLWNPWTRVLFEGDTIDFWNLKDRKGTVRFSDFASINAGAVYGDYQTLHKHIAFTKQGEKDVINELQTVRIYQMDDSQDYYLADITIQLSCASDSPVILQDYRYGGLGWRATEKWDKNNSETLTSEGKARVDADGSTARWVIVQGSLDEDYGGAVMMSYPTNYNHPEPLRIWPENSNGRGDVFANFSPTKGKDWVLTPGNNYILKYRLVVFNGKFSKEKAEEAWGNFANPPKVSIKLSSENN